MALILSLETSETLCSVALSDGNILLGFMESRTEKSHASMLTILIDRLLASKEIKMNQLDAVAVSKGPGSYTGLRIGVSVAKGICYAIQIPLIALTTLDFMRFGIEKNDVFIKFKKINPDFLICSMIDARRMEVYRLIQTKEGEIVEEVGAEEITSQSFEKILVTHKILFIGSGADKCHGILKSPHAFFIEGIYPHASQMVLLAWQKFEKQEFENLAYFEPFYLKDFVALTSKKKIFGF